MGLQQFIAVAGVAFLVFLAWRLGALRTARLVDGEAAMARFAQDYPSLKPSHSLVSGDGSVALLEIGDGRVGAVFAVGDKFATRLWRTGDLVNIEIKNDTLMIKTGDMTLPTLTLRGLGEADMPTWRSDLLKLCEGRA